MVDIVVLTGIFIFVTYLFGVLYAAVGAFNKRCLIAAFGWTGFCVFGAIGVPFHELSHMLTALFFGHDVREFRLYDPKGGKETGKLGYVKHYYSKHSLYQRVGNFFVGASPMLWGAAVLTALMYAAVPERFFVPGFFSFDYMPVFIRETASAFFNSLRSGNPWGYVLIFVSFIICPYIGMSFVDMKDMSSGVYVLIAAGISVPFMLHYYFDFDYDAMGSLLLEFIVRYAYVLLIGLAVSFVTAIAYKILGLFMTKG